MSNTPRSNSNGSSSPLALVQASKLQHASASSLPALLGKQGNKKPTYVQDQIVAQTDEAATKQAARTFLQHHANQLIVQMHLHTQRTYVQGIVQMNATANAGYDAESSADIKRWNTHVQKPMFERHLAATLEAGVALVAAEVESEFEIERHKPGLRTRIRRALS